MDLVQLIRLVLLDLRYPGSTVDNRLIRTPFLEKPMLSQIAQTELFVSVTVTVNVLELNISNFFGTYLFGNKLLIFDV